MIRRLSLLLTGCLIPGALCAQSTVAPKTTIAPKSTIVASGGGGASITFKAAQGCNTGSNTCNVTITPAASTDSLVVYLNATPASTLTVSDGHSTYTSVSGPYDDTNSGGRSQMWLANSVGASALTIACTSSSSTDQLGCVVFDIAKAATFTLDQAPAGFTNSTGSTTLATNPATTTTAAEILVACFGNSQHNDAAVAAAGGWTLPTNGLQQGNNQMAACEYLIVASTSTYTGAATSSTFDGPGALIATFK